MTVIKGKNFLLRPLKTNDEDSIVESINNKVISRNTLAIPYPYTHRDARKWIQENLREARRKKPTKIVFAIDIDGEVAGHISFHKIIKGHKAEMGYWLAKKYWNQGIMTEAVKLLTQFGFKKLGLVRIYAFVFSFNKASMKVLKKAGYKFEGIQRKNIKKGKVFIDDFIYAKTRS